MLTIMLFVVIFILSISLFLWDHAKNGDLYRHAAKLPGPTSLPALGNAHLFMNQKNSADLYALLTKIYNQYPSPSRLWIGNLLLIGIYDADQIKAVLSHPKALEKSVLYKFTEPWFGNGIIVAPVPLWRAHRKLIQPSFHAQVIRTFEGCFTKQSNNLIKKMEAYVGGGEFKLAPLLADFSLNVALESTMGISQETDSAMFERYNSCVKRTFEIMMLRLISVWMIPTSIFNHTQLSREFLKCIDFIHTTIKDILQKKKAELAKTDLDKEEQNPGQRKAFLDLLMELQVKDKFSDQDVCDEANTMIIGAYDTVQLTLQYAMLALASHPDIQEKAYQELYSIYGSESPEKVPVKHEDLKHMDYVGRVIQETLRVFSTIPVVMRRVDEDIEIGGYTVPKGCTALCAIFKVHRDEKYWPDPMKFDPDRFLPEEVAKRSPNCFLPFSSGPRNCIGYQFGMIEMKTVVAAILRKFIIKKDHIQPIADIKQTIDVLAFPVEPITVRLERRIPA